MLRSTAYGVLAAAAGSAALTVAALVLSGVTFQLTAGAPIQAAWMLLLGASVTAVIPLYSRFPQLEATFVRRTADRAVRAGITGVVTAGMVVATSTWLSDPVLTVWVLLAVALGTVSCILLADRAWVLPLVVGGALVFVDHQVLGSPVVGAMLAVGPGAATAIAACAGGLYVVRAPTTGRARRQSWE